ncbi:hypothetical protein ACHAWO_009650 [Cyclotella atomus]|uniref:Sulfotransferase domain-containing protein n=1 Tax=Cyclotella atomus TaxID=382360 RepID=A0ABD3NDU6_9STRA
MKNSTRLIALLLTLIAYAILSTSLFTKLLLRDPVESAAFLNDEVLVFNEADNADYSVDEDASSDDTDDDTEATEEEQSSVTSSHFTCDTEGAPDFLPKNHITRRSLHAAIIGTQKGGTQALHTILLTHPNILTSSTGHGELHFFNRYYQKLISKSSPVIPRKKAREAFVKTLRGRNNAKRLKRRGGENDISNPKNRDKVSFHSAPLYLFSGRKVPARMLCVAPWIKVIAILRNPIERVYSHYHFVYPEKRKNGNTPSFEQFVLEDIALLKQYGVLNDWNTTNFTEYSGSSEEYTAWENYLKVAKGNGPIGRGLYAIQLEIWMDEFTSHNKSISDDLLILQSESTKAYPEEAYHSTVQFLGLESKTIQRHEHVMKKNHHATDYSGSDGMSEEMYGMLYELFGRYNRRLYGLLGREWEGVWDDGVGASGVLKNDGEVVAAVDGAAPVEEKDVEAAGEAAVVVEEGEGDADTTVEKKEAVGDTATSVENGEAVGDQVER